MDKSASSQGCDGVQYEYCTRTSTVLYLVSLDLLLKHIGTVLRPTCTTRVPHVLHTGVPNDGV